MKDDGDLEQDSSYTGREKCSGYFLKILELNNVMTDDHTEEFKRELQQQNQSSTSKNQWTQRQISWKMKKSEETLENL